MSPTTYSLQERLTAVAGCVSSESLAAFYDRNTPLPAPTDVPSDAYLNEEVARVQVREAIARHQLCPTALLRVLAADPSRFVRQAVASVVSDGVLLNLLATDPHAAVREATASNPATSLYLLRVLCADEDPLVRMTAEEAMSGGISLVPLPTGPKASAQREEVVLMREVALAA